MIKKDQSSKHLIGMKNINYIFRVFKQEHFLDLLDTKELHLVHPSSWDDPFENVFLHQNIKVGNEIMPIEFRNHFYGQCWSYKIESDAMWRIYSPNKSGAKIKVNPERLLSQMRKNHHWSYIGKVEYCSSLKLKNHVKKFKSIGENFFVGDSSGIKTASTLLIKRTPFSHEKEVRIIVRASSHNSNHLRVMVDINELIEEIVLDPRMSKHDEVFLKNKIANSGYRGRVIKSGLYKLPSFE